MNPTNPMNSINSVTTTNSKKMAAKWGEITIGEIVAALGGGQVSGSPDRAVQGLSTDSRTMVPGHLFLALRGDRFNGHDFLAEAVGAGAAGLIVEAGRPIGEVAADNDLAVITVSSTLTALGDLASWWRKKWGGRVIAITGSNGKSTTKEMAAAILALKAKTMKSPGNFNNLIGLPLSILGLEPHHELAVLEMGMNMAGEIARLTQIAGPEIGVITNVASAHLEGLGDLKGVAAAKGELLEQMSPNSTAVLNGDNGLTRALASSFRGPVMTFGLGPANQVRAEDIRRAGNAAQSFILHMADETIPVTIHLPGTHNVLNALAGAAVAHCLSVPKDLIARGLETFSPLKGRFQILDLEDDIKIIDDTYNSNPSSLGAALQTIEEVRGEGVGLVVGLGEMWELGSESARFHFNAGQRIALTGLRYLVVLGEHGREVIEGACKGGMDTTRTRLATDHADMIGALKAEVRKGDIVFLKGSRRAALDRVVEGITGYFGLAEGEGNAL
jgi:UDP-N-acetylmuramoyl-tripeptide--D-alanyl-D-alanine ligase